MPGTRQRRGSTNQRPTGVCTCLCVTAVLIACVPAAAANGAQSTGVDGRQALKAAVALVQQGKLEEADRQAQRALADPETRPVAGREVKCHLY